MSHASLEAVQIFLVNDLCLGLFDVILHFFHSLVSSLLELIDGVEKFLLVNFVESLFVFLHLLEYLLPIFRHLLLQFFQLLLHLSVLTHSNVVVHLEIILIIVVVDHV